MIKRYLACRKDQCFGSVLLLSLLLHGVVLGILLFFWQARSRVNLDRSIVTIHLAKLGKKRDEKLLPRFDASEAVPEVKKELEKVVSKKNVETATPKKAVKPLDLLNKRFGKASDEGVEQGSVLGSSLQEDLQDSYTAQVAALIKQSYTLPAVFRNQQNQLTAVMKLQINAQGKLLKVEMVRSSGKPMFDNSVLITIRKILLFGVPPLQLRRIIATAGFELEFAP